MTLPDDCSFDPLGKALYERARSGAPPDGRSDDAADAIHAAMLAALVMVKLGSQDIIAVVGKSGCDVASSWCVVAQRHHGARCDALACVQCLYCTGCDRIEAATPDLHGCEHAGANRLFKLLLREWIFEEMEWLAGVKDQLGRTGVWMSSSDSALPDAYPLELDFSAAMQRLAKND